MMREITFTCEIRHQVLMHRSQEIECGLSEANHTTEEVVAPLVNININKTSKRRSNIKEDKHV